MTPLDADVAEFLAAIRAQGAPPLYELSVTDAREQLAAASLQCAPAAPEIPHEDRVITGKNADLPIRVYRPQEDMAGPLILFIHGGGWAMGSVETHDAVARTICAGVGAMLVSVDYGLAPEHPFPAGLEDCVAALVWCDQHRRDDQALIVMGDSAGANLAAALCLHARDTGGPDIAGQVLAYPCVDLSEQADYASRATFGDGSYFLGQGDIDWLRGMYFVDSADAQSPMASPMLAPSLADLPQALIVTASHDPLRDEGLAYHQRLVESGVPSRHLRCEGTIHGFLSFAGVFASGHEGLEKIIDWLRTLRNH